MLIPRKKKVGGGEGMVSGSRMSLFKRLSKCGGGSLAACGGANNLQATAPGDLAGSRLKNHLWTNSIALLEKVF